MDRPATRFAKAACMLDGIYWHIAKISGVKQNLFWLLYALDGEGVHTQTQICRDWLFPKTTINTLIGECVRDGYITLLPLAERGAEKQIVLTETGRAFLDQTLSTVRAVEERAFAAAKETCAPTFVDDFERFISLMRGAVERSQE